MIKLETVSPNMGERMKYKWNANFIDIYKANVTNFKNNIEESIHRAEVKTSLLSDDINNIVNVVSEALREDNERRRQLHVPHKPW